MTILAPVSETAFLSQILELSAMLGWEGAHFRPALTGRGWRTPVQGSLGKGWPDLVLVRSRDNRLIFAELKADKGKPSPEQTRVLEVLRSLEWIGSREPTIEVHVWRPADFDQITGILR